jgi:erythromycin esterase
MINRRHLLTGTAVAAYAVSAVAISSKLDGLYRDMRKSRIDFLQQHATPVRSLDFGDDDFSDLEPFAQAIGDARIVLLGEQSHGDGTTFLAKARFVRFLHERMGFDVLAFESGLYDMHKVWQRISAGENAGTAVDHGLYSIWTMSQQLQPLFGYLEERARSSRPLELAGFDCKFTGAQGAWLVDDLTAFLAANGIAVDTLADWPRLRGLLMNLPKFATWGPSAEERDFIIAALDRLAAIAESRPGAEAARWRQMLKSMKTYTEFRHHMDPNNATPDDLARRDAGMGDNMVWLAREAFAGRKIIVWAATYHNVRNMHLVGIKFPFFQVKTMGHYLWEALGAETYNVAFLGYEGRTGWANGGAPEMLLERPPAESLEEVWGATTHDNAFLDLRRTVPGGEWLRTRLAARPLGAFAIRAVMPELFDGAVFLRSMQPSTRVVDGTA